MIQTNNESPTVWSVDELMARLDSDCYLSVVTGSAVVVLIDEPESVEASMDGDDVQLLIDGYQDRLRYLTSRNGALFVYGSANERMKAMMDAPNVSLTYKYH